MIEEIKERQQVPKGDVATPRLNADATVPVDDAPPEICPRVAAPLMRDDACEDDISVNRECHVLVSAHAPHKRLARFSKLLTWGLVRALSVLR
ncbi:unnamed protein product [marine sediment metagenome]|uniref:Uncharacterized protein n=1 Tax=marine sediment metagenome TaxID=412755 RepID=X1BW19_9ZZZZ